MPPLPEAQLAALVRRYQGRLGRITTAAGALFARRWESLDDLDDEDAIRSIAPTMDRLGAQAAAVTLGFLAVAQGTAPATTSLSIDPEWRAPFIAFRTALARGHSFEEAVESGLARARATGRDAVVDFARRVAQDGAGDEVTGWRRVLTAESCDWCVTVSGRIYKSADSADFGHANCDCLVVPIFGDIDPGGVINADLIRSRHEGGATTTDGGSPGG